MGTAHAFGLLGEGQTAVWAKAFGLHQARWLRLTVSNKKNHAEVTNF
jgi:hypothetical protein